MARMNLKKMLDHKPRIWKAGEYLAKIVEAEEGKTQKGRDWFKFRFDVMESMDENYEVNPDEELEIIGAGNVRIRMYLADLDKDKPSSWVDTQVSKLQNLINFSNVNIEDDGEIRADQFLNHYIGIKVIHTDDDFHTGGGPTVAIVDNFVAVPSDEDDEDDE